MATTFARMEVFRKTAAQWASDNNTLLAGELGFELDTEFLKIGDGSTAWNTLKYWIEGDAIPGMVYEWNLNTDPATFGARYLQLNGQGILRANYPNLDANVYVGDGINGTASAYFRATDAAGTSRSISGAYLILPESRGYTTRGLDTAAAIDPGGASRDLGDLQGSAIWGHKHTAGIGFIIGSAGEGISAIATSSSFVTGATAAIGPNTTEVKASTYGTPSLATESRMYNRATQFVIRY